jgi:hypothetical protein
VISEPNDIADMEARREDPSNDEPSTDDLCTCGHPYAAHKGYVWGPVIEEWCEGEGYTHHEQLIECDECNGTGTVGGQACPGCDNGKYDAGGDTPNCKCREFEWKDLPDIEDEVVNSKIEDATWD